MKKVSIIIVILLITITTVFNLYSNQRIKIKLDNCIDGDTAWFIINNKREKVRFLGIDTPESVHPNGIVEEYGIEASNYTCDMLKNANNIYIEYDINSDRYDKYNRLLAWIFVDNNNLSELLLSKGYANVDYIYGDYKYIEELCLAQNKAYIDKLGVWNTNYINYEANYCFKNNY